MSTPTLEEFLYQDFSQQTAKTYFFTISHFLKMNPRAKRYKYQDIVNYMEDINGKYPNERYRSGILSAIKKYYDYLVLHGFRTDHPCKRLTVKIKNNLVIQSQDLFSSEELQLLMTRENRYQNLDTRNSVLLSLLIYQGLSCAEIVRLNVQDIDLGEGTIYVKASS